MMDTNKIIYAKDSFINPNQQRIKYQYWLPAETQLANLLLVHGIGEHCGRYKNVINYLLPLGIACYALDHQGHGRSGGKRGHVPHFSDFARDVEKLRVLTTPLYKDKPLYILGHSMGGLITLDYLLCYPQSPVAGIIFSSPAFALSVHVPSWKYKLGKLMLKIAPSFTMSNGIKSDELSNDKQVVDSYDRDELVHGRISAAMFFTMLDVMENGQKQATSITKPLILMVGENDHIISKEGALRLFSLFGAKDKTSYICADAKHELFNEINKEKSLEYLWQWLEPRIK
ncbi:MAG TPA: lysophospholipase [bacterium]|nr:lysophospholipase [bacterium]HPN45246.1 lysophospholipase [bacterium]